MGSALHRTFQSLLLFLMLVIFVSPSVESRNDYRKGFVSGIGFGYAPVVYWQRDKNNVSNLQQSWGYNFFIGYGIDARNVIAIEMSRVKYDLDFLPGIRVSQGISGIHWYHYWRDSGRSWFTVIGSGYLGINSTAHNIGHIDPQYQDFGRIGGDGVALRFGFGRELHKHLQLGAYYMTGFTRIEGATSYHHFLTFLATALFF